jgi:hypothetical protein
MSELNNKSKKNQKEKVFVPQKPPTSSQDVPTSISPKPEETPSQTPQTDSGNKTSKVTIELKESMVTQKPPVSKEGDIRNEYTLTGETMVPQKIPIVTSNIKKEPDQKKSVRIKQE